MIGPDDDDVRALRQQASDSMAFSRDRREGIGEGIHDTFSDRLMVAAIVVLLALATSLSCAPAASAADVRAERLLRAWCPASMPRRHCVSWIRVAQCETGGQQLAVTYRSLRQIRWRYDGGSGYDGALQFSVRTWRGNIGRVPARKLTRAQRLARERGAYSLAHYAPPAVQILTADELRVRPDGGMGHWPSCGGRWG